MLSLFGSTSLNTMDKSGGYDSLKEGKIVSSTYSALRDEILKTFQKVLGKIFLSRCPNCRIDSIGRFVFCPYCSKDGEPHRLLAHCDALTCWGNDNYFSNYKSKFLVSHDINFVCCHVNPSPVDGTVIRTAFACVVSSYLMFHDCLIDTTRQEIMLHNVHCERTLQLHYQMCLNMATIMQGFGELPIAKQIQDHLSWVATTREGGLFGEVLEDFISSHSGSISFSL